MNTEILFIHIGCACSLVLIKGKYLVAHEKTCKFANNICYISKLESYGVLEVLLGTHSDQRVAQRRSSASPDQVMGVEGFVDGHLYCVAKHKNKIK